MRRCVRVGIWSISLAAGGVLLGLVVSAYFFSRGAADLTFAFLAGRELSHHSVRETSSGKETVAVYCFPAYHDTVYDAAGEELHALGYREITPRIDYSSTRSLFDPRDTRQNSIFVKGGRTSATVQIGTGRFLEEHSDGRLSISAERDWIYVMIRQTQPPFSLGRELGYWRDKLFWWRARQRVAPMPQPRPA